MKTTDSPPETQPFFVGWGVDLNEYLSIFGEIES